MRIQRKGPCLHEEAGFRHVVNNSLIYNATLRNIELIGEAATHLLIEVREAHPQTSWRQIFAMRNQIAHAYLGLDDDVIWDIICTDIPDLLPALQLLLKTAMENGAQSVRGCV